MVRIENLVRSRDKEKYFANFDPSRQSWIVSDLRSKFYIQARLLEQLGSLPEESVLRISDLWRRLILRLQPDLRLVSEPLIDIYIKEFFATSEGTSPRRTTMPGRIKTAKLFLGELLPLLSHPDGTEVLAEWLGQNSEAQARWGHWVAECTDLWSFLRAKRVILPAWIPGILANAQSLAGAWDRDLLIDVGVELKSHETPLLLGLGEELRVEVLCPSPLWQGAYAALFYPYVGLAARLPAGPSATGLDESERLELGALAERVGLRRYATQIAEVKDVVAKVRQWLERGVPPAKIAIIAADIENYWPALGAYLAVEGIMANKSRVATLQTFADVAQWLARLRIATQKTTAGDLETALFSSEPPAGPMTVEKFKSLFNALYDHRDLRRCQEIEEQFTVEWEASSMVNREQFLTWALRAWPATFASDRLEQILRAVLAEVNDRIELNLLHWMEYVEAIAAQQEAVIEEADPSGVHIVNLMSAEELPATHYIFMGLSEEALSSSVRRGLLMGDVRSIAEQTGFQLAAPENNKLQFQLHWLLDGGQEENAGEVILGYSETDFMGNVQAPSLLWLMLDYSHAAHSLKLEAGPPQLTERLTPVSIPATTRWDELQKASLSDWATLRGLNFAQAQALEMRMREDVGEKIVDPFALGKVKKISPTALETFWNCPFQFAAQRVFRLEDLPDLDLDLDHRHRGSLMHRLFEKLTTPPMRYDYTGDELTGLVEDCRRELSLVLAEEGLWLEQRRRYVQMAQRFLAFEKQWRVDFPESQILGRETSVRGHVRIADGELVAEKDQANDEPAEDIPDSLSFSGKIDRIDGDRQGRRLLIDYKSSLSRYTNAGTWLQRRHLQMGLYTLSVERGLVRSESAHSPLSTTARGGRLGSPTSTSERGSLQGEVVGAVFYSVRDGRRDRGFLLAAGAGTLYPETVRHARFTDEQKQKLLTEIQEQTGRIAQAIVRGEFAPLPAEEKLCNGCAWRNLCRYHRLS